jgi:hypothetical protein
MTQKRNIHCNSRSICTWMETELRAVPLPLAGTYAECCFGSEMALPRHPLLNWPGREKMQPALRKGRIGRWSAARNSAHQLLTSLCTMHTPIAQSSPSRSLEYSLFPLASLGMSPPLHRRPPMAHRHGQVTLSPKQ